jgi:uncharacterized protein
MTESIEIAKISDNKILHNFELTIDGVIARVDYHISDDKIYLDHLVIPFELIGKGIGQVLTQKTLDYIAANNLKVVPRCPVFRKYLQLHPEYSNLVAPGTSMIA